MKKIALDDYATVKIKRPQKSKSEHWVIVTYNLLIDDVAIAQLFKFW